MIVLIDSYKCKWLYGSFNGVGATVVYFFFRKNEFGGMDKDSYITFFAICDAFTDNTYMDYTIGQCTYPHKSEDKKLDSFQIYWNFEMGARNLDNLWSDLTRWF